LSQVLHIRLPVGFLVWFPFLVLRFLSLPVQLSDRFPDHVLFLLRFPELV